MTKEIQKTVIKPEYEKPKIVKGEGMSFINSSIGKMSTKYYCRQCSSCHGCR
jgi:hypothetical protein